MRARSRQQEACWGWMMDRPYAGWRYAGQLFGPSGSYLPDDDKPMDWLYKARAVIGVAILVTVGIHYHQATQNIIAYFNPVLGGITEPMVLELLSVVPATVAAVLFTRQGKRDEAFRRMLDYPLKVAVICLIAYGCIIGAVDLGGRNTPFIFVAGIIGGLIYLRFILFPFRAIYLITVGMCRLGDGHPLLPPIIGTALAWVVACQSLLTGSVGTGAHAYVLLAVLLGGPMSITLLSHLEISRLRRRYPNEFPFRDGPLPARGGAARDGAARAGPARPAKPPTQPAGQPPYQRADWYQQASPYQRGAPYQRPERPVQPTKVQENQGGYPSRSTRRRRYPWSLAIVSTIVPGLVLAAYTWHRVSGPVSRTAAVETSLSKIKDGQCIQYKPDHAVTISSLPVISCSAMHWGQFLGLESIGNPGLTVYPGDAVAIRESAAVCTRTFNEAVGSNLRGYALWYSSPDSDAWENEQWSSAACIAEAGDSMPYEGSLSQQPEPASPARDKAGTVPLSAVSLHGRNGALPLTWSPTAAPFTQPVTTASVLPPAPCGTAEPSDDWLGSSGARANYQLTQGESDYAEVDLFVAPLTQAGQQNLPGYLSDLPKTCYSPHWFSYQDGMNFTSDNTFARPADGTRLLDMGYGKGSASYLEYWTVSDGYLLEFVYYPSSLITIASAREPMHSALAGAVTHINSVLHTHLRA
jgi:hypothetical protein